MSGWIRFNRHDCPVCNGVRNDCRQSLSTGLIHCRTGDADPVDYVFRGEDSWGFGMWVSREEVEAASEEKRREWQQQREIERQHRLAIEAQRQADALTVEERDRAIRKILRQLGLNLADKNDLLRRGLTLEQINQGMFRSVEQWQKLEQEVSHRLAGVNLSGYSLITQPGYFCPLWSINGLIIGWQLRLKTDEGSKYKWASSATKKRPHGPTSHLKNGELPLTVCRPKTPHPQGIGLIEGVLKPYIAAHQPNNNTVFVGAAGGNFTASPQQLGDILAHLSQEQNTKLITLYPDAGAVSNLHVYHRDCKTLQLLQTWGYEVQVASWGQFYDQSQPDFDELSPEQNIEYIQATDYLLLAQPQQQWAEPDATAYAEYIAWEKEQEKIAEAEDFVHFTDWLQRQAQKVRGKCKGFGKPLQKPVKTPKVLSYDSEVILPSEKDYKGKKPLVIRFQQGKRLEVIEKLTHAGWRHILDKSMPGLGKSYDAGLFAPPPNHYEKLWYLSSEHRNPTTWTIEQNYTDMPVRHNGLVQDWERITPLHKPFLRWAKEGECPDIRSLCYQGELFLKLKNQGYAVEGEPGELNPICQKCPFRFPCGQEIGKGYGFRKARAIALEAQRIRSSPDSVPNPKEYRLSQDGAFWDEWSKIFRVTEGVCAELKDFDQQMAALETSYPELFDALKPLRMTLRPLLAREIEQPYHGWNDVALRDILPPVPENLAEMIAQIESMVASIGDLIESPDTVRGCGGNWRTAGQIVREQFRQDAYQKTRENFAKLATNWLLPFLKVWGGLIPGSLRLIYGQLTVTTRSFRHSQLAEAFQWNVYQDATVSPEYLALCLGIEPQELVVIEQETPKLDNLTVIQVEGFGVAGKNRSEACEKRITALKTELEQRHSFPNDDAEEGIAFLDWMGKDQLSGWWFNHSRGTNEWEFKRAIASFGIPYQNIGTLEDTWLSLGNQLDDSFTNFVTQVTQAEIIQAIGRLRAYLRPDEELTYYFCADYDLGFLKSLDCKLLQKQAFEICPTAGTPTQVGRWSIIKFLHQAFQTGRELQKVTQSELATVLGCTQGWVSQLMKPLGGWIAFKKLLVTLLKESYSMTNNFAEPDFGYFRELLELPPLETVKEVVKDIQNIGWQTYKEILQMAHLDTQMQMVGLLLGLLPPSVLAELEELIQPP